MISSTLSPQLEKELDAVFGSPRDEITQVERRADDYLGPAKAIIWEGDPQTFHFSYVSPSAELILGYSAGRWVREPSFWVDTILHPEDRNDAVAFCALATGRKADHDFIYRAVRSDGSIIRLHDIVKVVIGSKGVPVCLRGIMIPLSSDEEGSEGLRYAASVV